jgi:predicted nucleotidyltransferase
MNRSTPAADANTGTARIRARFGNVRRPRARPPGFGSGIRDSGYNLPMAPDTSTSALSERVATDQIRSLLERTPGVALAVVFGSMARAGSPNARDLDIAVLTDADLELPPFLGVAIERATQRVVDLVHLNTAPPLLRFEIARDGVVLVERRPHTWADFRQRAMVDWWDWAPLARRMHGAAAASLRTAGRSSGVRR